MRLTARDRDVLGALATMRWLSTRQVARLGFASVSIEMARRRLRLMRKARYVRSVRSHYMAEALHTLGSRGKALLAERGWPRAVRLEREPPRNLEHFLGINDIHIAVEQSAARAGLVVAYFLACWELPQRGWSYAVIPDAVASLVAGDCGRTVLFEYDRGNEGRNFLVRTKFSRYAQGLDGFTFDRVITVVDTVERLTALRAHLARRCPDARFSFLLREALIGSWGVGELFKTS